MSAKVVARMMVLAALGLVGSPAFAAQAKEAQPKHGSDVSGDQASPKHDLKKSSTKHSRHKGLAWKKKGTKHEPMIALESKPAPIVQAKEHPAEPKRTPEIAASIAEPMISHKPGKIERAVSREILQPGKLKPVVQREKSEAPVDVSSSDKPTAKPAVDKSEIKADPKIEPKAEDRDDKRLLKRSDRKDARPSASIKAPCMHEEVEFVRGEEQDKFPLSKCDGAVAPLAVEKLSVLVRPETAKRPDQPLVALSKGKGTELSPGVRKMDSGLVARLQEVVDHFAKKGAPTRISIISGYRPNSTGSFHATGQALDMSIAGVSNDALVAFCKTLPDTGCGYYPNSSFVHLDVRAPNTGHVYWIDTSGPGEPPRYVSTWPPPPEPLINDARQATRELLKNLDRELPPLPVDTHPAESHPADTAADPAAAMEGPLDERQ